MLHYQSRRMIAIGVLSGIFLVPHAQANPLNDTGIDVCRAPATGADTAVSPTTTCQPLPAHGAQDARYGRDAAAIKGVLSKVGSSAGTVNGNPNGFDFTKISNSGAALPATATLGGGPDDWACTYDNNTGLLWEVKVNDPVHLRHHGHTYTWYDTAHNYGGNAGTADTLGGGGACQTDGRCDTEKFVADVNAVGLCGHDDWRLPARQELYNIADRGRVSPSIDSIYFPNTPTVSFWTASPHTYFLNNSLFVSFGNGFSGWSGRNTAYRVRLVRAGR